MSATIGGGVGSGLAGGGGRLPFVLLEPKGEVHMQVTGTQIPSKGDRVEQHRFGVVRHGYVWYADELQVLVKWEDGKSNSLRLGCDYYIATAAGQAARIEEEVAEAAVPELAGASVS